MQTATLLANKGKDLGVKQHGRWKSSTTAEGYIKKSVENKIQLAKIILLVNKIQNRLLQQVSKKMRKTTWRKSIDVIS